jgi:hypothetical protein
MLRDKSLLVKFREKLVGGMRIVHIYRAPGKLEVGER